MMEVIDMSTIARTLNDMRSDRWNLIIMFVNYNTPIDKVRSALSQDEFEEYARMRSQLQEDRKSDPKATYWPIESDW